MRTVLAFLVAPLCVPLIVTPLLALLLTIGRVPHIVNWLLVGATVSLIVSYTAMLAFGVPGLWFFRALGLLRRWIALTYGFAAAVVVSVLTFAIIVPLVFGQRPLPLANLPGFMTDMTVLLIPSGLVGTVVALIFWAIARPDKTAR